jgi:hypothetical protein
MKFGLSDSRMKLFGNEVLRWISGHKLQDVARGGENVVAY